MIFAMAYSGISKFSVHVKKLCNFGHFTQLQKRSLMTTCTKSRATVFQRSGALLQHSRNKVSTSVNTMNLTRTMSTIQTKIPVSDIDPFEVVKDDLKNIIEDAKMELSQHCNTQQLHPIFSYYLDNQGKKFRPLICILMARAMNCHKGKDILLHSQRQIAMISEIMHTATLLHDDIVDQSELRRGKPSLHLSLPEKQIIYAGVIIFVTGYMTLSKLGKDSVTLAVIHAMNNLLKAEFRQLDIHNFENLFERYIDISFLKTGSLIANPTRAVTILSEVDKQMVEIAWKYGKNVGIILQLTDDLLDFTSTSKLMLKPVHADLKLGIATAPVLFACEQYPELNAMIMRRFREPGDIEKTIELVQKSDAFEKTKSLMKKYTEEAIEIAKTQITKSPYQEALLVISQMITNRMH